MIAEQQEGSSQVLRITHSVNQKPEERNLIKKRFLVRSGENLVPVPQDEVAYFRAFDKWTYLISKQGKQYLIDSNLKLLEAQLDPESFFRLNRQYFVNIASIKALTPYFKGQVTVKVFPEPKEQIIVSRKRTAALKSWISN